VDGCYCEAAKTAAQPDLWVTQSPWGTAGCASANPLRGAHRLRRLVHVFPDLPALAGAGELVVVRDQRICVRSVGLEVDVAAGRLPLRGDQNIGIEPYPTVLTAIAKVSILVPQVPTAPGRLRSRSPRSPLGTC
jgi:hypothetical protein